MGEHEAIDRGGKYEYEILEFDSDNAEHRVVWKPMKERFATKHTVSK